MRPCKHWLQKCAACQQARPPGIDASAFNQVLDKLMLDLLEERNGITFRVDPRVFEQGEDLMHKPSLCEFCGWGDRNCTCPAKRTGGGGSGSDDAIAHLHDEFENLDISGSSTFKSKGQICVIFVLTCPPEHQICATLTHEYLMPYARSLKRTGGEYGCSRAAHEARIQTWDKAIWTLSCMLCVHERSPTRRRFIERKLNNARDLLSSKLTLSPDIRITSPPIIKPGKNAVEFVCSCDDGSVPCDVLIGALDAQGQYLRNPSSQGHPDWISR